MGKRGRHPIPHQFIESIEHKFCMGCMEWKSITDFIKKPDTWDKLESRCRKCKNGYRRKRWHSDDGTIKEKASVKAKRWYWKNREKVLSKRTESVAKKTLEKATRYCASCKTFKPKQEFVNKCQCEMCAILKTQKEANNKFRAEQRKQRGIENKSRRQAAHQRQLERIAYRQTDEYKLIKKKQRKESEKRRLIKKRENKLPSPMTAYFRKNKGKRRQYKQNRRAAIRGSGGTFEAQDWQYILEICDHRCLKCGNRFDNLTRDHILMLGFGSNTITNLQPYCRSHNSKKGRNFYEDSRPPEIKYLIYKRAFPNLLQIMESEPKSDSFCLM